MADTNGSKKDVEKAIVDKQGNLHKKLLEKNLKEHWNKDKVTIKESKVEPASEKGTNFTSDAWRVTFTYTLNDDETEVPFSVIVKSRPSAKELEDLMNAGTAFTNEIFAYEQVIPTLGNIVGSPLRVPEFYGGDENSIVLEDMGRKSFKNINKKLAVEWNQLWSSITEMAKLHAASIVMNKLAPEKFNNLVKSIKKNTDEETTPLGEKQSNALFTILKVLEEAKTPEATKHMELLEQMRSSAWQRQKEIIEEDVPIRVINHGSVWINNLMYRKDMVTLLDWQHIVYSSPAHDLSFFLYVNIDSDFLTNKKQKLIDFYLVNLHQFIYDATVNKLTVMEINELLEPLTYEWINEELKRFSIYGFMMAQWIAPAFYWSEAVFQTLNDLGGLESMKSEERMKHITSDQKDRMIKLTQLYFRESK
ncbi:uncharacterized protein LOC123676600 [Harmonia axyridis]|uniref:uncharacterized protein LOC123676600 n=1 Tax=Harmonia axyridis TaxID=115357 RepID=UPI001E278400|nr:uncharacterized protein LOC123676600 [Harmonia axyridis]